MNDSVKLPGNTFQVTKSIYQCKVERSFESVCDELAELSSYLLELLPDPALSPNERVERLARVIPSSVMYSAYHQSARMKLKVLTDRLNELVPDKQLSNREKIDFLLQRLDELVPQKTERVYEKLELLGDHRRADNGR